MSVPAAQPAPQKNPIGTSKLETQYPKSPGGYATLKFPFKNLTAWRWFYWNNRADQRAVGFADFGLKGPVVEVLQKGQDPQD